jgi:hypothetical protein
MPDLLGVFRVTSATFILVVSFLWVIPRRNFICRRFGTECSETLEYKIRTPGNHRKERKQHSEQGESFKSRITFILHVGKTKFSTKMHNE